MAKESAPSPGLAREAKADTASGALEVEKADSETLEKVEEEKAENNAESKNYTEISSDNEVQKSEEAAEKAKIEAQALAEQKAESAAWSHLDMAHHYQSRFDFDLADVEFEQSILNMPSLKVAHRDYCLLCLGRLNVPKAVAEFMLATGLGDPVPYTPFEKAELDARAAKLHYRKALSYGRTNRWAPAIRELKWALSYAPKNSAIRRSLAFAYANAGLFEDSERQYADSFIADPGDAYSRADFAYLLSQEGKATKAMNQMSEAVALEPHVAALHVDLAWFSEKNGDLGRASKELQEAVKLSPKHAILWAHLGRLAEQLGDHASARKAYSEALALDPQLAEAKEGLSDSNSVAPN